MKIVIVSDAWFPQVNGVVRTLDTTAKELRRLGHEVDLITPDLFRNIPCPTYPEIRLAILPGRALASKIDALQPCAIHISTEGPLGFAARRYCLRHGYPFTTAVHTRFPEYIQARTGIPTAWTYRLLRWFHRPATRVMVATESLRQDLAGRGFGNLVMWSRGVDLDLFEPMLDKQTFLPLPRPVYLYVGRVAVEKNISAFLDLSLEGTKLVVGEGPQLTELKRKYPAVQFVGAKFGSDLARHYAASDVFVFPSRTDTFGLVLLEALASGVPVAAYPVTGPKDVINGASVGILDENLASAALRALQVPPADCRAYAQRYTWQASAKQFLGNLAPFRVD